MRHFIILFFSSCAQKSVELCYPRLLGTPGLKLILFLVSRHQGSRHPDLAKDANNQAAAIRKIGENSMSEPRTNRKKSGTIFTFRSVLRNTVYYILYISKYVKDQVLSHTMEKLLSAILRSNETFFLLLMILSVSYSFCLSFSPISFSVIPFSCLINSRFLSPLTFRPLKG
jgi:hypothetical protein